MRKKIAMLLGIVATLCCVFAFGACSTENKPSDKPTAHVHNWSQEWDSDDTHHWHNCTADGCDVTDNSQKDGYGAHDFTNGDCFCGAKKLIDGLKYIISEDKQFYVCTGLGTTTDGEIVIESSIKDETGTIKPVTCIGHQAFYGCSGLTSITIPDSVTSIGDGAFYNCSDLTSITIPDSVAFIGYDAFYNTAWYNNQPNGLVYAGKVAYKYKGALPDNTSITIEEGTTSITGSAFYGCSSLTSIAIPDSVTSIGNSAFYGCSGLTSITFGNSVISIGDWAFSGCRELASVTIPNSVITIGNKAFINCSRLTSATIGNSVTVIGDNAFNHCRLKSITIPNSVTSIGGYAFNGCPIVNATIPTRAIGSIPNSELTTVVITAGTTIGYQAFQNCSKLTSITIPDSVTSIDGSAFSGCPIENATVPGWAIRFIPKGNLKTVIITNPNFISPYTFENCSMLTNITILDSVTEIGGGTFEDTAWYNNQPDGLVYAGRVAYKYKGTMPDYTTIILTDGTKGIANYAFEGCGGLTSITIPNSVITIGYYAFHGCYGLTSITIPNSVTEISDNAFNGCNALTSITIPNSVCSIGWRAFSDCSGLTSINYNGTIEQWGSIERANGWNDNMGNYTVHCTDGDLDKYGNVI